MKFPCRYNSTNGDAVFNTDFNHQLNQEVVVKPGEKYSSISVNITDDVKPENNETFVMTLTTSDDVTAINDDSTTVTILNNGNYSKHTHERHLKIGLFLFSFGPLGPYWHKNPQHILIVKGSLNPTDKKNVIKRNQKLIRTFQPLMSF